LLLWETSPCEKKSLCQSAGRGNFELSLSKGKPEKEGTAPSLKKKDMQKQAPGPGGRSFWGGEFTHHKRKRFREGRQTASAGLNEMKGRFSGGEEVGGPLLGGRRRGLQLFGQRIEVRRGLVV